MREAQKSAIIAHGNNLLAIFTNCTDKDPLSLCKKLRRFEQRAYALSLRACNGPQYGREDDQEKLIKMLLAKLDVLLKFESVGVPVFINLDARGYALKIDDEVMRAKKLKLYSDWGGYGIIAPQIDG